MIEILPKHKRWKHSTQILLILFGSALIYIGHVKGSSGIYLLFYTLGGSIVGAAVSILYSEFSNKDTVEHIFAEQRALVENVKKYISEKETEKFTSRTEDLISFEGEWHQYTVTKMDSKFYWRYRLVFLEHDKNNQQLRSSQIMIDKNGAKRRYITYAGIRDERYLSFSKPVKGSEQVAITIMPRIGNLVSTCHAGVLFHQTWDMDHSLSPQILSRKKHHTDKDAKSNGIINDSAAESLDTLWLNCFKETKQNIFPRVLSRLID